MKPMLWPILGAVRFVLAWYVAGAHLLHFTPRSPLLGVFDDMSSFIAVLGFLIISGYSIAASHAREPAGFYRRRVLRLMPLYLLAIAAGVGCVKFFGGVVHTASGAVFVTPPMGQVAQNLFFGQGFTSLSIETNAVVWSLSIEVFFYVLAPVLARLSQGALVAMAAVSLVFFVASTAWHLPNFPELRHGAAATLLGWAWLAGFIAYRQRDPRVAALVIATTAVWALIAFAGFLPLHQLLPLGLVGLAIGWAGRLSGPQLLFAGFTQMGDASYPLYLFHLPLYITLCGLGLKLSGSVYLGAAVIVAFALDRFYDQPVKALIRRAGRGVETWANQRWIRLGWR